MFTRRFYDRYCKLTIIGIIFLFFIGGMVRITGAGMGCPDWPKCFGQWVPPTDESQLPDNFEKEFIAKRKIKNSRLADILKTFGFDNKASIVASTNVESIEPFNVRKTYTEYVNRLWGAITGIFALIATLSSFQFWKKQRAVTFFSLLGVLFVAFNGWLGSVVVDTNLLGGIVTIHFLLAFGAITSFMLAYYWGKEVEGKTTVSLKALIIMSVLLSLIQLILGTSVREKIDILAMNGVSIGLDNFGKIGESFTIHRIISFVGLALTILVWQLNRKGTNRPRTSLILLSIVAMILLQILTGVLNIRMSFPAVARLLHIVFGSLTLVGFIYLTIQELKSEILNTDKK
ncbi:MAG: COX15/CtaA family protein [Flavobacteriales bacterium]|nr:COX15/CtaA family protein [Flavobacteriales bacterium]